MSTKSIHITVGLCGVQISSDNFFYGDLRGCNVTPGLVTDSMDSVQRERILRLCEQMSAISRQLDEIK